MVPVVVAVSVISIFIQSPREEDHTVPRPWSHQGGGPVGRVMRYKLCQV